MSKVSQSRDTVTMPSANTITHTHTHIYQVERALCVPRVHVRVGRLQWQSVPRPIRIRCNLVYILPTLLYIVGASGVLDNRLNVRILLMAHFEGIREARVGALFSNAQKSRVSSKCKKFHSPTERLRSTADEIPLEHCEQPRCPNDFGFYLVAARRCEAEDLFGLAGVSVPEGVTSTCL